MPLDDGQLHATGLSDMRFDVSAVPFSRFGSHMAISYLRPGQPNHGVDELEGLYLRCVHNGRSSDVFRIELGSVDDPLDFDIEAEPSLLVLRPRAATKDSGLVEISFESPDVLRVRARRVPVRLVRDPNPSGGALPSSGRQWRLIVGSLPRKFLLDPISGDLDVNSPWQLVEGYGTKVHICPRVIASFMPDTQSGELEFAIESYESEAEGAPRTRSFDRCVQGNAADFGTWLKGTPSAPTAWAQQRELAAYVNWSAVVAAEGNYETPAMLMSKNWMVHVYNWDNYFNAWANSYANDEFAWNQFMLFFRHQHSTGALADYIDQFQTAFTYTKPPIHGWVLRHMMANMPSIDRKRLSQVYEPLQAWTQWWLTYHDDDGDGICQYNHGNDSGWDNASVFDVGQPVESPDLSAYLILQMDALAEVAEKLGRRRDAVHWAKSADQMLERLLEHSWRGDRFIAPRSGDHQVDPNADSLILLLPLVLGSRLPESVRRPMVARLREPGGFLTPFGLATESLRSPNYLTFGYWRGPIWAPSTLVIVDGLVRMGEKALAREIARRFCDLCVRSGFAENFDAVTGDPLCDKAYTWTSSIFAILTRDYLR